jgi:hypothetical protein
MPHIIKASFWVGNPENKARSDWLGLITFGGYPTTHPFTEDDHLPIDKGIHFSLTTSKKQFKRKVEWILDSARPNSAMKKGQYATEETLRFPSLIIDYTYAYYHGQVHIARFNLGWKICGDRRPWPDQLHMRSRVRQGQIRYDPNYRHFGGIRSSGGNIF